MSRPAPLKFREVSNIAMTTGGEKKHPIVIVDRVVKEWVGIGWSDLRRANADDRQKYPEVV